MSESPAASESPGSRRTLVDQAVEDLVARVPVRPEEVEVVSEEEVVWRDGSVGCAQKGMSYTQALVDGRRIVLRVDGRDYEYHAGRSGAPFYCAAPTE